MASIFVCTLLIRQNIWYLAWGRKYCLDIGAFHSQHEQLYKLVTVKSVDLVSSRRYRINVQLSSLSLSCAHFAYLIQRNAAVTVLLNFVKLITSRFIYNSKRNILFKNVLLTINKENNIIRYLKIKCSQF